MCQLLSETDEKGQISCTDRLLFVFWGHPDCLVPYAVEKFYKQMKILKLSGWLLAVLLLLKVPCASAQQQKMYLQSGTVTTKNNLSEFISGPLPGDIAGGYYYRFLQFTTLPDKALLDEMSRSGLVIMDYIPANTYFTAIPVRYDRSQLKRFGVFAVEIQTPAQKISRVIMGGFPDWAYKEPGMVELEVRYQPNLPLPLVLESAAKLGRVTAYHPENFTITLRMSEYSMMQVAAEPWVFFINAVAAPEVKDDTKGRSLHRSNVINSDFSTGRHYDGSNVTVAIADDGFVGPHIDFTGRMTNFATGTGQTHGDMTSGICVGAGNLNPVIRGMATGAYLYTYNISGYPQIVNAVANYNTYGIVITSTSYSQGCNAYNTDTQFGDNLLYNNRQLMFVFSGGNSNGSDCGYGAGGNWGNITGGYKQGKNVIACGNLDELEVLDPTSSKGPSADGRVKPDICANGRNQLSTDENNAYQVGGGTSAASPGVAGVTAQLYQAYKQLTGAPNPPGALIKACLLNSAEDIGNAGPDFTYGWGRINAMRALQVLENNRYLTDSVTQGNTKTHTITVPAGTRELRVMVYWADVGGSPAAAPALVNNINMSVTDPSAVSWNPWILDKTPNAVNLNTPAVRGIDSLNNVEQVTLANPAAGNYTVNINGYVLPSTGVRYYLVWEFRSDAVTITYPNGGEGFVPGETEVIRWDGQRDLGTYTLEYTTNNGAAWTTISSSIAQNVQQYSWLVPSVNSGQVKLRITRGVNSDMSDTSLAIIAVPTGLAIAWACPDSLRLTWNAVSGAAGYTVYKLGAKYMEPIGTTTGTAFVVNGINPTTEYWFSVCANTSAGNKGRRAYAIKKAAGVFSCPMPLDVALDTINSPNHGNLNNCQNTAAVPVTVTIENTGQNAVSNVSVSYRVNGGAIVTETHSGTINAGASVTHTFSGTLNLAAAGSYAVQAWVTFAGDMNAYNDSDAVVSVSTPVLITPASENFELATYPPTGWSVVNPDASYTWERRTGITGATGTATAANYINNYTYNSPPAEDYLMTPVINLISAASAQLTFDVAYARYGAGYEDGLRVDISADCGQTWTSTGYLKTGLTLATAGTITSLFTPTSAAQWRKDTINLSPWTGNKVMLRFVNINDYGNSLYIDNTNITSVAGNVSLTVGLIIEGFYLSGGQMTPVRMNAGVGSDPLAVDSVTVRLHQTTSPFAVVASSTAMLNTSGQAVVSFPAAQLNNSYYISVVSRNAVETWSKTPVLMSPVTTFNFKSMSPLLPVQPVPALNGSEKD